MLLNIHLSHMAEARFELICDAHKIKLSKIIERYLEDVPDDELLKIVEKISPVLRQSPTSDTSLYLLSLYAAGEGE